MFLKKSCGLTGEITEGFLEEVALALNLIEREEYEQTNMRREQSGHRDQLEQRFGPRNLLGHLPPLVPGKKV